VCARGACQAASAGRSASPLEVMPSARLRVRDPGDDLVVSSRGDLDALLDAAAAEARTRALLNVVVLIAGNGNELSLVVGSTETVLGFSSCGPPLAHYASLGTTQTTEPLFTAYVALSHHTEFPRRFVIPASQGRAAAIEFLETGTRPTSVTWVPA